MILQGMDIYLQIGIGFAVSLVGIIALWLGFPFRVLASEKHRSLMIVRQSWSGSWKLSTQAIPTRNPWTTKRPDEVSSPMGSVTAST